MDLATLVHQYYDVFMARFGETLLPDQRKALDASLRCRTPASGELYVQCPDCHHGQWRPLSCGNRHCPRCQNHLTSLWIDKQREKLLPVPYFMVTFTLPYQLRSLAYRLTRRMSTHSCSVALPKSCAHLLAMKNPWAPKSA